MAHIGRRSRIRPNHAAAHDTHEHETDDERQRRDNDAILRCTRENSKHSTCADRVPRSRRVSARSVSFELCVVVMLLHTVHTRKMINACLSALRRASQYKTRTRVKLVLVYPIHKILHNPSDDDHTTSNLRRCASGVWRWRKLLFDCKLF